MLIDTTSERTHRALQLVVDSMDWVPLRGADGFRAYALPSQNPRRNGEHYIVNRNGCTCEDHHFRGVNCKHMVAVELYSIMVLDGVK